MIGRRGLNDEQIPMMREFYNTDGHRHALIAQAAASLPRVTLDWEFLKTVAFDPDGLVRLNHLGRTFFKEVSLVRPLMGEAVTRFAEDPDAWSTSRLGGAGRSHPFLDKMKQKMAAWWNPEALHVCFHTSGYDSRLISGILMQLRDEMGGGWLGHVKFVCFEPEGELFKKIMELEGWKPQQFGVYREGWGMDYRSELVEFDQVWRWVNSYCMPWFVLGPALLDALGGRLPDDRPVQVLSGMFGNELTTINTQLALVPRSGWGPTLRYPNAMIDRLLDGWYWRRDVTAHWSAVACEGLLMPLINIEVAPFVDRATRLSGIHAISDELASLERYPDGPLNIPPNWFGPDGRLSVDTRVKAAKSFSDSEYAKNLKLDESMAPPLGNSPWWRDYVLASTCERLVESGVEVIWNDAA